MNAPINCEISINHDLYWFCYRLLVIKCILPFFFSLLVYSVRCRRLSYLLLPVIANLLIPLNFVYSSIWWSIRHQSFWLCVLLSSILATLFVSRHQLSIHLSFCPWVRFLCSFHCYMRSAYFWVLLLVWEFQLQKWALEEHTTRILYVYVFLEVNNLGEMVQILKFFVVVLRTPYFHRYRYIELCEYLKSTHWTESLRCSNLVYFSLFYKTSQYLKSL